MIPVFVKEKIKHILEKRFQVSIIKRNRLIGMTSHEEKAFFTEVAKEKINEEGAIVDLGTWMGSTAASLAKGLQAQDGFRTENGLIYSFDRYIWEDNMHETGFEFFCKYEDGEIFLPETRKRIEKYLPAVKLIQCDLNEYEWEGQDIKILLVDAMKNQSLCEGIINGFYPFLKKDAILIHQDFKHWYTPFIHISQYRLRDYFTLLKDLPASGSTVFQLEKQIPVSVIKEITDFSNLTNEEADRSFEYSLQLSGSPFRAKIAAAHMMYYILKGDAETAQQWIENYKKDGFHQDHDMIRAVEKYNLLNRPI